ncbi:hypothetical protein EU545_05480 [Candidatus Thorarchaeota archaeon]|nr:MAG: hypothetical protein EU545_05480 [Candidatus Thorarchaeota archaeon]
MTKADMTQARVMKIEKGNVITLPGDFVDGIGHPYGLAILVMKDKNVKLYPVDSDKVLYLKLDIDKLSKSFLEELTLIFESAGLEDILFTSGICQSASQCYYECYFTPQQLEIDLEKLREKMKGITGVQKVILHEVPVAG